MPGDGSIEQKSVSILRVTSDEEVLQILEMQKKNLQESLGETEIRQQGFVTVQHSLEVLLEMNRDSPAVIAKKDSRVVGYALVMPAIFRNSIPILEPMFQMMEQVDYNGKRLIDHSFFIMGQVCIDKDFRGLGLFDRMYQELRDQLSSDYELMITEVASRNQRSLRAHERVGLKTIHTYADHRGEQWEIMVWDWR